MGVIFSSPFSSPNVYEGDIEASAKDTLLKKGEINCNQKQRAIDSRFPPDQVRHAKMHAVLSYVLRVGYFQVVGFLQSLLPFQRMMEGDELSRDESWGKCLTYTKAIFSRIYDVQTVSADRTPGTMLYEMLLSSEM